MARVWSKAGGIVFCIWLLASGTRAEEVRIVSFAPGITELVCRLGGEQQLVGRTRYCVYPEHLAERVTTVGGLMDPDWERLLASEAELILVSEMMPAAVVERMVRFVPQARVEVLGYNDWEELKAGIARLGSWMGKEQAAAELLEAFAAGEAAVAKQTLPPLRTVVLYGVLQTEAAGSGSFPDQILLRLGLPNIAAANGLSAWPRLSLEFLLQHNPQLMILADADPETSQARWADDGVLSQLRGSAVWREMDAVKSGRVVLLPATRLQVPDSQLLDTLLELHALLASASSEKRFDLSPSQSIGEPALPAGH